MNTKFTIKNFRVFDESGVTMDIKPLTFLTGCNSSGKSSIVKAMLILKHFFIQIKNAYDLNEPINLFDYKIDIATEELKTLGNFANTINRLSDSNEVTFEYTIYSLMLSKDVNVCLTFSVDANDELKNGLLQTISLRVDDTEIYCASRDGLNYTCNLDIIKNNCFDFIELVRLINNYCSIYGEYNYDNIHTKSNEEYETLMDDVKAKIMTFKERTAKDAIRYVYTSKIQGHDIMHGLDINQSIFDWTRKNGSYFMIPVIEELDKISKEGIRAFFIEKLATTNNGGNVVFVSNKIADDFISSDATSFSEYFKRYEEEYLESIKPSLFARTKSGIPNVSDFTISQDYSSENPENYEIIDLFGEYSETDKQKEKAEDIKRWEERAVDFPMLYEIVMLLNKSCTSEKDEKNLYYTFDKSINLTGGYQHYAYMALCAFFTNIVKEVLNPYTWSGITYSSSSRVDVSPYYNLSDPSRMSAALKRYFDVRRIYQKKNIQERYNFKIGSFINDWIKNLGIGDGVSFEIIPNLEIVTPKLHKQEGDNGYLLTDEGFGITQLLSVLIVIETQILSRYIDRHDGKGINRYVGISDLFNLYNNWTKEEATFLYDTIAIEEPEIHLHPNYQSKLADMFVDAYNKCGIHFVVETHSEYLIRKLQLLVSGHVEDIDIDRSMVSIYYIHSEYDKSKQKAKRIGICCDGYLDDSFGEGFYDEATRLSRLLM